MWKINMDWSVIVSALIAGTITIAGLIFGVRKDRASVAEIYEKIAANQALRIDALQERLNKSEEEYKKIFDAQQTRIDELECRIEEYEAGITLLITQLEANKIVPLWKPNKSK